jgi:uncharacterized protein YggE
MSTHQDRPFGVHVSGSWQLRVEPDCAQLAFAVSRLRPQPQSAFDEVKEGSRAVRAALVAGAIEANDIQMSRIVLQQETDFEGGKRMMRGYRAKVAFAVRLERLDQLESVLTSVVQAGADEITGATFHTTRLRALREEARTQAVAVARAKAEALCAAAGVKLGHVLHIEEGGLNGPAFSRSNYAAPTPPEEEMAERGAMAPGSIAVDASVVVAYGIAGQL